MAVLITGGAGFIGSELTKALINNGYDVVIADNLSNSCKVNVNKNAKFIEVDICNPDLEEVFAEKDIDYVFHLAAQSGICVSENHPELTVKNNIYGSLNVFNLCKKYNVKRTIAFSSAAVYGNPEYLPIDENHKLSPISHYGISKHVMEIHLKKSGIDFVILRPSNVYGKSQMMSKTAGIITKFSYKMKNNEQITIFGTGEQTRDFIHISDVIKACIKVLELSEKNFIMNVSTGVSVTVNELFQKLSNLYNYQKIPMYIDRLGFEAEDCVLDNGFMVKTLKFIPEKSLNLN